MDKFLKKKQVCEDNSISKTAKISSSNSNSSNSSSSSSSISLINQLRHASTTASKSDAWEPYLQSNNSAAFSSSASILSKTNTYSLSDIAGANREAAYKKQASNTGWKVVNGVKIYSTFRNGGKVQGEGAEGFKLAMGDKGKNNKGKKQETGKKDSKPKGTTEPPVTKKRKVQEVQSIGNDCNEKQGKQQMIPPTNQQNQAPSNSNNHDDLYGFSFD